MPGGGLSCVGLPWGHLVCRLGAGAWLCCVSRVLCLRISWWEEPSCPGAVGPCVVLGRALVARWGVTCLVTVGLCGVVVYCQAVVAYVVGEVVHPFS